MAMKDEGNALWSIFGYLLSGMLFWGGVGYGLDKWLNQGHFLLIGLLLGIGAAIYLVWLRFGREQGLKTQALVTQSTAVGFHTGALEPIRLPRLSWYTTT